MVDGEMRGHAPWVLGVDSEALHALGKTAIASGRGDAGHARRDRRSAAQIEIKLRGIRGIEAGILRIIEHRFGGGGEGAAEGRLMNGIDAEPERMRASHVTYVVANLIFFLVAPDGECSDWSDELIVAERFEAGDGAAG